MNRTLDDTNVRRDLPPVWELLRAASGLVAVLVLAGVISATVLLGESRPSIPRATDPVTRTAMASELAAGPRAAPSSVRSGEQILVFYVVLSRQQAEYANQLENESIKDTLEVLAMGDHAPYRTAYVLHARNEDELTLASRSLLDDLLENSAERLIQVVDLREAEAADSFFLGAEAASP